MPRSITAYSLGRVSYEVAFALQENLLVSRLEGAIGDTLLLLDHPPVVTLGRGAKPANVRADRDTLARASVSIVQSNRGGDVTYHGPGQLVAYPIFDLRPDRCDVRRYVRDLARVMVGILARLGVAGGFIEGDAKLVGVWVDLDSPSRWPSGRSATELGTARIAKVGAIGVRISRWVTMHGFALNIDNDLGPYRFIVPCGISDRPVTSVHALLGVARAAWRDREPATAVGPVVEACAHEFARVFDADVRFGAAEETARLWSYPSSGAV